MTKQPTIARISKYFESLGITNINAVMEACREFQRGRDSAMLDIKEQYLDPIREILDQDADPYDHHNPIREILEQSIDPDDSLDPRLEKIDKLLIECEEEYYDDWE